MHNKNDMYEFEYVHSYLFICLSHLLMTCIYVWNIYIFPYVGRGKLEPKEDVRNPYAKIGTIFQKRRREPNDQKMVRNN